MNGGGGGAVGGSRGNGTVAAAGIPVGVRKMVQSLKEIVNLPDQEIYAMLKECGMDPSEAVQRLLSQDSFHEVKSKRDKKKEMKEPPDSRSRTTNNSLGRGVRGIFDRGPRNSSIQSNSNGNYESNRGKAIPKKEDVVGSVLSSSNMGSSSSVGRKSTIMSDNASSENLWQSIDSVDGSSIHSQPSSGYPHTWAGMPGHFSMADIVKMGRPQGKLSASSTVAENSLLFSHNHSTSDTSYKYTVNPVRLSELDQRVHGSHQPVEDIDIEPGTTKNENVSDDGWSSVNQPDSGTASAILETFGGATYSDVSKVELIVDEAQLHQTLNEDEIRELDQSSNSESLPESESISEREFQVNSSEEKSKLDDDSPQNMSAYLSQRHLFDQQVEDVNVELSSVSANLQNLRLQKDGLTAPSLEDNPAVIIPRHLQVTNADCSHLSFGSFGSGIGTSFSGSLQQKPLNDNSEVTKVADVVSSLDHSEARNSNYYDNDELKSQINEDAVSRGGMNAGNYEMPSASEPELIRDDTVNKTHELQYNFPSLSGYGASTSAQHSATAFSHPQTNLQMQNFTSLSTLMQPYTSSLPSSLLAPSLQPLRDIDLPFSSLLASQSLSTKHSATTSINGPSISIHEPRPSVFSNLQQVPQSSSSPNLPAGHAIPQHLHINPYSQATLPLGPFPNVISYPFLPQSYYLPSSAFPQAYTSNGPFHQSTSAVHSAGLKYTLPPYKNSLSAASLPQPAAVASPYGNYNSPANVPGNFVLNPSTTSTSTTLGFDEALSSQKEGTHYLHLQQNDSSPMWVHNGSSRTVSPLPPNTFYGFQGQSQLNNFRQAQQPAHYGPMGYLNLYQNHQLGGQQSQEHQQNPGEANLNGSQGNPSQSAHQIWQHGY